MAPRRPRFPPAGPARWSAIRRAALGDLETYGEITIACTLGQLDIHAAHEPWRRGHPRLTAWYERLVQLPPMAGTMPAG